MKRRSSSLVLLALSLSWTVLANRPPVLGNWEVSMKMARMDASPMKQTRASPRNS